MNLRSTNMNVLGELVLLDWQMALDAAWLAKSQTYQPLGVWLYKGGAVVAACLKEKPRQPLKDWLSRGNDHVRVEDGRVTIDLPQAHILDSSLDEDKTKLYDRERGC